MKKTFLLPIFAGLMLMSCTEETPETPGEGQGSTEPVEHTITASIAGEFRTKTILDGFKPVWSENDKLELYTAEGTYEYTLQDADGTFTSPLTPEGEVLCAAYPAENAIYSVAGLTVTLPSTITYSENGFICPLYAEIGKPAAEIGNVEMQIPVGMINVNYQGVPDGYSALVITSTGGRISGAFSVVDGTISTIPTSSENVTRVTFETLAAPQDMSFYIPAPVGQYASITFKLTGDGKEDLMVADMSEQTIEKGIVYSLTTDKNLILKWGDIDESALVYPYAGESRDYPVISNADWTVTSSNPAIEAVKKDDNTVTVTVPAGQYIGGMSSEIKISSADPSVVIAPAVINISQEGNPAVTVVEGSDIEYTPEGYAVLSINPETENAAQVSKSYFAAVDQTKYGTHTFEFDNVNLAAGFFGAEWWFSGGNMQAQIGYTNRVYYQDSAAGDAGTSHYFSLDYSTLNAVKQLVIKVFPKEGGGDTALQIWFDGTMFTEQFMGTEVWADSGRGGSALNFGLNSRPADQPIIESSLTIKSYSYTTEY